MATSTTVLAPQKALEDPLAHLPCSSIVEYKKGQMIYNQDQPSTNIYLIIEGKIKVSRVAEDGHQVVVDMYQPDEFFGESALLKQQRHSQAGDFDFAFDDQEDVSGRLVLIVDHLAFLVLHNAGARQMRERIFECFLRCKYRGAAGCHFVSCNYAFSTFCPIGALARRSR